MKSLKIHLSKSRTNGLPGQMSSLPRAALAFTLVELLIVCAILSVLIGMLVMGVNHLNRSSRIKATHVALENLNAMLSELEASTPNQRGLVDMEKHIWDNDNPAINNPKVVAAPNDITASAYTSGASTDRYNSNAVKKTQAVMDRLYLLPAVRDALSKYPEDRKMSLTGSTVGDRAPILLDDFGNPILYVPTEGMTGVDTSNGTVTIPGTGHGYWISAGPDGCVTTLPGHTYSNPPGDDNITSARH